MRSSSFPTFLLPPQGEREEETRQRAKAHRQLPKAVETRRKAGVLARTTREGRARLRSAGGKGAGAGLSASPTSEEETCEDGDFCAAVRLRLGQGVCPPPPGHCCSKRNVV